MPFPPPIAAPRQPTSRRGAASLHGECRRKKRSPEYLAWNAMLCRCRPSHDKYKYYGGRGITIHQEWRDSFKAFLRDVGRKPTPQHSLERIDNNKGYEPGNVRWATRKEQGRNKRNNHLLTVAGKTQTMAVWAEQFEIPLQTLWARINRGWDVESAVTTPLGVRRRAA